MYLYKNGKKVKFFEKTFVQFLYLYKNGKQKKAEEELTRKINSSSILDEAVPEINIPILKPVPARKSIPSLRSLAGRVSKQVKGKINKFSDWLISFVPETISPQLMKKLTN